MMDTQSPNGCVSGWDRLMSCAQKAREEKEKLRFAPEPAQPNPVAEQAPAAPESEPIAIQDDPIDPSLMDSKTKEERP